MSTPGPSAEEVIGMEFPEVWLRTELARLTHAVQQLALRLQPDGGQGRARRNAWRGLSEDRQRREQRLEAERSAEAALLARAADVHVPEQYSSRRPVSAAV